MGAGNLLEEPGARLQHDSSLRLPWASKVIFNGHCPPRCYSLKALMPAWAECDGQCSDVIVWTGPGSTYSAAGPGDMWGVPTVISANGVDALVSG